MSKRARPQIQAASGSAGEVAGGGAACCSGDWISMARGCMTTKSKYADRCLVDIRTHAARLYCVMHDLVDSKVVETHENRAWRQAVHHLFVVQAITKVEPDSSFHNGNDVGPCSVWYAYDAMVDEISENYLTAAIRFSSIFTALECVAKARHVSHVVSARDAKQNRAGAQKLAEGRSFSQLGDDLDARFQMSASMRLARDAARAACLVVGDMDLDLDDISRFKDGTPCRDDTFAYCLKLVKKFRNNFAHGHEEMVMPDNDDLSSGKIANVTVAMIDRHNAMSRIALMLMQLCLIIDSRCDVELKVGQYEDENEDWQDQIMMASGVLDKLQFDNYGACDLVLWPAGPHLESVPKAI